MKEYKTLRPRELMRVRGKITPKDCVVITVSINTEIPIAVFEDMIVSCKAAFWEYIDERAQTDERWKEVSSID